MCPAEVNSSDNQDTGEINMAKRKSNGSSRSNKKARVRSSSNKPTKTIPLLSDEKQHHMVSEAAYFRALNRGFEGGDPFTDWLEAEKEIRNQLQGQ